MALVTTKDMLQNAHRDHYAVGAFNIENMEMAMAVVAAAEKCRSPVILQTTPSTLRYAPPRVFYGMVSALAEKAAVPIALHLDHGDSLDLVETALQAGYTSVMFDGSQQTFSINCKTTRQAALLASANDIPVEGELGRVGGKEDDTVSDGATYTDPHDAEMFAKETGVSSLAIGVGTAHGVYKTPPRLNIPLIAAIRERLAIPLVLHGASGLAEDDIKRCIANGISKINFATELRQAYTTAARTALLEDKALFDPKAYNLKAMQAVQQVVEKCIALCGSKNKI